MFKKPLSNLKTSAPLRSSDRRKLKQRVITAFNVQPEDGDVLVPDGIESVKFITHLEEPGVAYLSKEGDPLWFTIGKGSEDLIPTVYTLWKKDDLLPFLSTPSAVIPILTGGADLMIPGVVHHTPALPEGTLVSIRQYSRQDGKSYLSVPLAVGQMALPSHQLTSGGKEKGKAVLVSHVWKDYLWEMGSKPDVPDDKAVQIGSENDGPESSEAEPGSENEVEPRPAGDDSATPPPPSEIDGQGEVPGPIPSEGISYTPQEVSDLLTKALLQSITASLGSAPPSTFPIPATLFYTNHILPSRPAFPTLVQTPSSHPEDAEKIHIDPQEINIKSSSNKSLTAFLKSMDKLSLLTLKQPQKHSQQSDSLVTSVNGKHPLVLGHVSFPTVRDIETKAAKKAAREEKSKMAEVSHELGIRELWKPHLVTVDLFKGLGGSPSSLYTPTEIRSLIFDYVVANDLVNKGDKSYVNLNSLLRPCLEVKSGGKSKGKEPQSDPGLADFIKRDELIKKVMAKMQNWYEIQPPGKDPVQKKGQLKPIQVVVKIRQGRKASTMITGFEPFVVVDAEEMAEDLRKVCAGATSVSPCVGKPAGSGFEVLVQGKQGPAVVEYLTGKGIPKRWIEVADLSGKK
ncbi:eukaryotic translation initiation factor SUI1 family protein [Ephemerocybe angulata]|uniref:Eukaryotic translation initiation factor SUI1 family protein n=1 Tax=Ephemerocybe angulata TaxID=980116 RepID=A0A8H6LZ82_9AGAR|nr:eukaryotic translation initiation factor SUI1 family protein [Tulosesus angulatus]